MAAVAFDYSLWTSTFPELSTVNQAQAASYWTMAGLYLDNTASSPVTDDSAGGVRATLLNLLTAHLAALFAAINGQAARGVVGRIDSATTGSVSVHLDYESSPGSEKWYSQTPYGAAYWAATAPFRSFLYVPSPTVARFPTLPGLPTTFIGAPSRGPWF